MYPSSRRLNSLSRSGGCVRDPHTPALGADGGVIIDAGYGKLGRRRLKASGSCSIVSYNAEDVTVWNTAIPPAKIVLTHRHDSPDETNMKPHFWFNL
jgi:hypothetical protein